MPSRLTHVPFPGSPPQVAEGDPIEIRDAGGTWHRSTAMSGPRYDDSNALGRTVHLTVAVRLPEGSVANWPAEGVRRLG